MHKQIASKIRKFPFDNKKFSNEIPLDIQWKDIYCIMFLEYTYTNMTAYIDKCSEIALELSFKQTQN